MLVDESGLLCICGQWVGGNMHGECRALMTRAEYERRSSQVIVADSGREAERDEYHEYD